MKLNSEQKLYVRSMGKALSVTAIFTNDADANAFMAKNRDDAVVAVFGIFIFLAKVWDKGETIKAGVQPDPVAARLVSECAELLDRFGDHELGDL